MFPIKPADGEVYAASNGTSYKYDSTRNAWNKTVDDTTSIIYQSLGIGTPSTIETSSFTGGNSVSVELSGSFNDPLLFNVVLGNASVSSLVNTGDYTNNSSLAHTTLVGSYAEGSSKTLTLSSNIVSTVAVTDDYTNNSSATSVALAGAYTVGSPDVLVLTNNSNVTTLHAEDYAMSSGTTRANLVGAFSGGVVTNYNSISTTDYDTTWDGGAFTIESPAFRTALIGSYSNTATNVITLTDNSTGELPATAGYSTYTRLSKVTLAGAYSAPSSNEATLSTTPVLPDSIDFARYSTHTVELTT